MEVAVEVFEQGQKRSFVRKYNSECITVGRSWNNDIIIRDPMVDAHHLVITSGEDGKPCVADLGTANGTFFGKSRVTESTTVAYGKPIRIGHSQIHLHSVDQPVAPAQVLSRFEELIDVLRHPAMAVVLAFIAVTSVFYSDVLRNAIDASWSDSAGQILTVAISLLVWSVIWGTVARLMRHEMAIWGHMSLVSLIITLGLGSNWLIEWIAFNSLSIGLRQTLMGVFVAVLMFGWMVIGLDITARMTLRAKNLIAGIATLAVVTALYVLPAFDEDKTNVFPNLMSMAKPPDLLVARSQSSADFLSQSEDLFAKLEDLRDDPVDLEEEGEDI